MRKVAIGAISWLFFAGIPAGARADSEPDFAEMVADEALAEMALNVVEASVNMRFQHREQECTNPGIFISSDGLALFVISAFGHPEAPTVVEVAGGKRIKPGKLIAYFPEYSVGLMKFDHEPDAWTSVAGQTPKPGDTLAVVPPERHCENCPMNWPIVASVNSVWCRTSRGLKQPAFGKVFSMVSGMSSRQEKVISHGTGRAVVNHRGELMGLCLSTAKSQNIARVETLMLSGLGDKIQQAIKDNPGQRLPVPEDACPVDPALADDDYRDWQIDGGRGDPEEIRAMILKLRERYPDSVMVLKSFLLSDFFKEGDLLPEELPPINPGDSKAMQQTKHLIRSLYWSELGQEAKVMEHLRAAVELSPPDEVSTREMLVSQLIAEEEWEQAEGIYRDIYQQCWGWISSVENFERILTQLRKWEEVDACADRIIELGNMGRRQRGGGERVLRERVKTLSRIHGSDSQEASRARRNLERFLEVKAATHDGG